MNIWWDKVNKWLYLGTKDGQANQLVFLLDNYFCWLIKGCLIRKWSLFEIMWDNGAWWAMNLDEGEVKTAHYMNDKYIENKKYFERKGIVDCFFQITILGIGIRYNYAKPIAVYETTDEC